MNAITRFLTDNTDPERSKNWRPVLETGRFRYWLIRLVRCDNVPVKLLREDSETDDVEDVTDNYREMTYFDLRFLWDAQRALGDW
jgi:hypothetical protein